ncbi:2OG-Fe(II) oxygenase [Pleionea sp. CnH1-48]|uniref:2OG-Fe(II) oxygenase n=1 Tax=Pleionea sp. CnH1-48 TaxID=2954494 RepID=UPI0020970725|nr:2OG-Fe(II) oxygenase [Pleionea sp. CnH1-48]MCO7223486.1 2OG-Fe(II) oxygenase [Pleionea sp. CnH1-48]
MNNDPFFGIYENSLPASFCRQMIQRFESDASVTKGLVGNGTREGAYQPDIKDTTEIALTPERSDWAEENKVLMNSLGQHLNQYMKHWGKAFGCAIRHEPIKIAKYNPGAHFDWHSDNLGGGVTTRVITCLWYLNTVEEGGETEYPWQKMKVKPVEGRLLLCPVGWTYVHRGAPPVSNAKYIAITQLHQVNSEKI